MNNDFIKIQKNHISNYNIMNLKSKAYIDKMTTHSDGILTVA